MDKRALEIFEYAATLASAEQLPWVTRQCSDDRQLHDQVMKMLTQMTAAERSMQTGGAFRQMTEDYTGQNLNGYQIEEIIGRGGMGVI